MEETFALLIVLTVVVVISAVIFIVTYTREDINDTELVIWAESGIMNKSYEYEVYEFDGKLYAINTKDNIVIPIDEKDRL
jgi:hypothetical protein